MSVQFSVALVGGYNSSVPAHRAIPLALDLAAAYHGTPIHWTWVPTGSIQDTEAQFKTYQGIWCVPASPYQNTQGALSAIRFAREQKLPFLGTCGGFQHALLEYTRNVLGIVDAAHAETDPEGSRWLIAPLKCSLVETWSEILLEPNSILSKSYGAPRVVEGYRCSHGPNPEYEDLMFRGDLWITARGLEGEVRAGELCNHPFFVGTLFQPERRALDGELPPLVREFSRAIIADKQSDAGAVDARSDEAASMHCRAFLCDNQLPYLRTSAFADARIVQCQGRNRPGDECIQRQTPHRRARRNQTAGSTSSDLTERNVVTQNLKF